MPRQRGNVSHSNLQILNAILYVTEHGCKWRGLPKRFGNWHTIYTRMNRWTKSGVLQKVFEQLQQQQIIRIKIEAVSMDSTSIKVHPDGTGALKKTAHNLSENPEAVGPPKFIWLPQIITFALSPGHAHDAPAGRQLLLALGPVTSPTHLLMDRAYEGDQTRQLALELGCIPVVPLKTNRLESWEYDRAMYKKRNEIERLFRRLKGFRRIFSRFDKLDIIFLSFIYFTLIVEALRYSLFLQMNFEESCCSHTKKHTAVERLFAA